MTDARGDPMSGKALTRSRGIRRLTLRPCVDWFAQQMERVLRQNDHKGGWDEMFFNDLIDRLHEEVSELENCGCKPRRVIKEAADVANFAMMIADQHRDLVKQDGGGR